jgi:hypothetical protein
MQTDSCSYKLSFLFLQNKKFRIKRILEKYIVWGRTEWINLTQVKD